MTIFLSVLTVYLLFGQVQATAYCSLTVNLHSPDGAVVNARVIVEEEDGSTTQQVTRDGVAQFCALGFSEVTVRVGDEGCNHVITKNVPINWRRSVSLHIIYDLGPCSVESPAHPGCEVLFRFLDQERRFVKGVKIATPGSLPKRYDSDEYGRVQIYISPQAEFIGEATAIGHRSVNIRIPCTSENYALEKKVILERLNP